MLTAYLIFSICVNVTLLVFVLFYARKNARQAVKMAELRQTLDNATRNKKLAARNERLNRINNKSYSLPIRFIEVTDRVNFNYSNIQTALEIYAGKYVGSIIRKYRDQICQELDFKIFNRLYELYMENKNDTSPLIRISVPVVAPIVGELSVEKTTRRS